MKNENVVLMQMAREALKGKWGLAIGTFVVYMLIAVALQMIPIAGPIISLLISGPFALGIVIFTLSVSRNEDAKLEQIFQGFKNFGTAFIAYLLIVLFTLLWMLLLIIPGFIASISYSMTFYIIADEPSIGAMEAIDKSKAMMNGYKWKYFYLQLRLFGLFLLCILTLGIGLLWFLPYAQVTTAKFYDDLKTNSVDTETIQ